MTSGSGAEPPARRDNGLRADQFVPLADVDPRLGEHLLDLLRLAEIPAYLEPSTDPRVAVRYRVSGPVERLYVHADQRQEARAVVVAAAHEAGESTDAVAAPAAPPNAGTAPSATATSRPPTPRADVLKGIDTDAEFARIIAGLSGPAGPAGPAGPGVRRPGTDAPDSATADEGTVNPSAPDASAPDAGTVDAGTVDPVNRRGIDPADLVVDRDADHAGITPADLDASADAAARARDEAQLRAALADSSTDDAAEGADDHFHPPPAPPFPVPTANTVGAVALLLLGVVVLLRGDLFGLDSNASFPASILLLLVASGLLIRGLRDRPEPGEEPEDDGAAV